MVLLSFILILFAVSKKIPNPPNPYKGEKEFDIYRHPELNDKYRRVNGKVFVSEEAQALKIEMYTSTGWFFWDLSFYNEPKNHYIISNAEGELKCTITPGDIQPDPFNHVYFKNASFDAVDISDPSLIERWYNTSMPLFCKEPQIYECDAFTREIFKVSDEDKSIWFEFKNIRELRTKDVFTIPIGMKCIETEKDEKVQVQEIFNKLLRDY